MAWVFEPAAADDFAQAVDWYCEQAGAKIAEAFAGEVRRTMNTVGERSELGTPGVAGTRKIVLRRFPFVLVYRIEPTVLRVIALAHQRRRPDYWRNR